MACSVSCPSDTRSVTCGRFTDGYSTIAVDNSDRVRNCFWPTVLALTKMKPEREWIKSMFDIAKDDDEHIAVRVFKDDKPVTYPIPRQPVKDSGVVEARYVYLPLMQHTYKCTVVQY